MSTLVLQIVITQWDKSQRSEKAQKTRSMIADRYPLLSSNYHYLFENTVVLDQQGDDLMGGRIHYTLIEDSQLSVDRFRVDLKRKNIEYMAAPNSVTPPRRIGSLDDNWIQCQYDWRYSVYEGGFYYWLYESITLNAIYTDRVTETLFMDAEPAVICSDLV
jgi:hypothetical protein